MFGLHKSSITLFYHHYTKQPFLSLMTGSDCLLPLIIEHHVSRHMLCIWMLQALLVLAFGCPEVHMLTGKRHSCTVMLCPVDEIFLPYSPHTYNATTTELAKHLWTLTVYRKKKRWSFWNRHKQRHTKSMSHSSDHNGNSSLTLGFSRTSVAILGTSLSNALRKKFLQR